MKRHGVAALLLGGGGGPAWAQGITLSPSLTISEEYDDNILLSAADRQSDFVTSVSPGLPQRGRLSLTYDRSAGVTGAFGEVVTSHSLTAIVSYSATRAVTVALEGGVRTSEAAGAAADFLTYGGEFGSITASSGGSPSTGATATSVRMTGPVPSTWNGIWSFSA